VIRKQLLALVIVLFAAVSASSKPAVVGSVMSSQAATVRDANLKAGFTIFSGDTIEVGPGGSAWIALPNGGQVQVAADSQVRLTKTADAIELTINRGHATAAGQVSVINHASPDPGKVKGSTVSDDHNKGKGGDDDEDCEVGPHHKNKQHRGASESNDHCHDH
jgi:hypothetical protein